MCYKKSLWSLLNFKLDRIIHQFVKAVINYQGRTTDDGLMLLTKSEREFSEQIPAMNRMCPTMFVALGKSAKSQPNTFPRITP